MEQRLLAAVLSRDASGLADVLSRAPGLVRLWSFESDRRSPLTAACWTGSLGIAQTLVDAGADVDQADCTLARCTPLFVACMCGHGGIASVLLGAGADPNRAASGSSTPLAVATLRGHRDIVRLLLGAGADPEASDTSGSTALHVAAARGHTDIARELIAAGANVVARDRSGRTPLVAALLEGHRDTAGLLESAGSSGIVQANVLRAISAVLEPSVPLLIRECGLTRDEVFALTVYTYDVSELGGDEDKNVFVQLNSVLRARGKELEPWRGYLYFINSALRKLPDYRGSVFRGSDNPEAVGPYVEATEITWSAFTSTSTERAVAAEFAGPGGVVFRIKVLRGKDISPFSAIQREAEVLLPPNAVLFVTHGAHRVEDSTIEIDMMEKAGSFRW
eukprot:m51a1_g7918 hypothetical protein (392) ;mRNA; r:216790-218444